MSAEYRPMVTGDYLAWLLGAADREGVTALPEQYAAPVVDEYVVGEVTETTLQLLRCVAAIDIEVARKREEVKRSDSKSMHDAFEAEVAVYVEPGKQLLTLVAGMQARIDLGPEYAPGVPKSTSALVIAEGGKVLGLSHMGQLADIVAKAGVATAAAEA